MQLHHYIARIEKAQQQFTAHTGRISSEQYLTALTLQDFGSQGRGWRETNPITREEAAKLLLANIAIRVTVNSSFARDFRVYVDPVGL